MGARPGTPGIGRSHRKRKLIEQAFGRRKTVALFRKLRHRGGRRRLAIQLRRGRIQPGAMAQSHRSADLTDDGHRSIRIITATAAPSTTKECRAESRFFSSLLERFLLYVVSGFSRTSGMSA